MTTSIFELFTIGIGPSSSHTVGPMRAARRFAAMLNADGQLASTTRMSVELYGSLALTGRGHGTDRAIQLGLQGETPESVDPDLIDQKLATIRSSGLLHVLGQHGLPWRENQDLVYHPDELLPGHANAMRFHAFDANGNTLQQRVYYSTGGGFVVEDGQAASDTPECDMASLPYPCHSGTDLLRMADQSGLSVSQMTWENERHWRSEEEIRAGLMRIWHVMQDCVRRGCRTEGVLPGTLRLQRRAGRLFRKLNSPQTSRESDPLSVLDWVDLYALAVAEENAAGGRVVTAPTNGAAGIVPATLHYYDRFCGGATEETVANFLLAAGTIGILYKERASISGAEVGCQGEVGVACSMAAAALTETLGGTVPQVEEAAEIGMEHNLGLTCDPVAGLVQVPCIERNAMGAVKAINASRLALRGTGRHRVSLDRVIETMRQTGADMQNKYKETSLGGLAVSVTEC